MSQIITIKRTNDLNYFSLCALNVFNTRVSKFKLNYTRIISVHHASMFIPIANMFLCQKDCTFVLFFYVVILYWSICLRCASKRSIALCVTIRSVCFCIWLLQHFIGGFDFHMWIKLEQMICRVPSWFSVYFCLQSLWTYWYIHCWSPLGLDIEHLSSH